MTDDRQLMCALIHGVQCAMPEGGSERDVTTLITRPLWRAFMEACGNDPNCEPTGWIGYETRRVFGSRTCVVEREEMAAVSFATPDP